MNLPEIRRLLVALRVAFDDADAVTKDALRRRRDQELGPVLQKRNYHEAADSVVSIHTELMARVDAAIAGDTGAPH